MAGEGANLAAAGAGAVFEVAASANTSGFFFSLKIDSPILAGVALAGALSLGAFYLSKKHSVENAIRNALEERNENGADPEVRNIGDGSILVELYCHTDRSLLQFVDDLEAEKVKHRLQKEFSRIGFNRELVVTIGNAKEVYRKVQEIRFSRSREVTHAAPVRETQMQKLNLGNRCDPEAPHEIKLRVVPQNLDVKKQDTSSHQFSADINMFLKQNTFSPTEGLNAFLKGLEDIYNLSTQALKFVGLEIRVECVTLGSLERLWKYFLSRRLNEIAEMCILTDEVKKKLNMKNMRLTTVIKEEDYETCRRSFIERLKPSSAGAVMELHEITVKITTHNAGGENLKESNQNFEADVLMFLNCKTFSPTKGTGEFLKYIEDAYNLRTKALGFGCLEIGLKCANAEGLKRLWTDYESGHLNKTAERCLLTDEVTENPQMKDVRVKTVIKHESTISLQYHYKDLELKFAARYGIDGKERMEVDDEPVVQLPHEVQLNVSDTQECRFQYDYSSIQDDVIGNMGFLENFVDSPPVVMKTVRCIIVYLWEKDTHGIHLVPENDHLTITKVDEHGRTSAFIYRSNPAKDTITVSECQQIKNFVGVHPTKKWLISVLWLLSELAVKKFGKQG